MLLHLFKTKSLRGGSPLPAGLMAEAAAPRIVMEYSPPAPVKVSADVHVWSLIALAFQDGLSGEVRPHELVTIYREMCFLRGYVPLSERLILSALGQRLRKRRVRVKSGDHTRWLTYYVMPQAASEADLGGNVVSFCARKSVKAGPRPRSSGRSTRARAAAG